MFTVVSCSVARLRTFFSAAVPRRCVWMLPVSLCHPKAESITSRLL